MGITQHSLKVLEGWRLRKDRNSKDQQKVVVFSASHSKTSQLLSTSCKSGNGQWYCAKMEVVRGKEEMLYRKIMF